VPPAPQIKNHAKIDKSIIGWDSQIGAWSRLEGHSILGKDVQIKVGAGADGG
jgi:mannose-1-phosphate guanylyltransferase